MELSLNTVRNEIHDARAKWYDIGLELKVPEPTLKSIESKYVDDKMYLREVVAVWLKAGDNTTWESLVDALRTRVVDEPRLAAELEAKYCSEIPVHEKNQSDDYVEPKQKKQKLEDGTSCGMSGIAITERKRTTQSYCAQLYVSMKQMYDWRFYFVITQDLDAKNAVVREYYRHIARLLVAVRVKFEHSEITLDIPEDGLVTNEGWRITPFTSPTISRKDVDEFQQGKRIPGCELIVKWTREDQRPVQLSHKVDVIGAKAPYNYIHLTLDPADRHSAGTERTPSKPQLKDLMDALYHKVADKWKMIGVQLDIPMGNLAGIAEKYRYDPQRCLVEMLETWLERVYPPATWAAIIEAVEFLGEEQLGKELREKYSGSELLDEANALGIEDLADITSYLHVLDRTTVFNLCLVLGLGYNRLKAMLDSPSFLQDMLAAWLQRVDHVLQTGVPTWTRLVEALKNPRVGQNGLASKIEQDKLHDTMRRNQCYEREMHYGFITTFIVKLLLFGIAGSGKTSVTAIMMGDDPPQVRISTPLMIRPVQVITIFIDQLMEWKRKTAEEVLRIIAKVIRSRETESQVQPLSSHSEQVQKETTEDHSLSFHSEHTHEKGVEVQPTLPQPQPQPQPKSLGAEFDSLLESAVKEDDFLSQVHNSDPPTEPILKQSWLYITDSGGQPEFHNMLSIFVQNTTACIFVFRVHEGLDDCPPVAFYDNTGNPVSSPRHSRLTNRQIFQQFMSTMRSFISKTGGDPPRIILLATHRDLVKEHVLPKLLQERHKQLKAIVLPQFKGQLIYCDERLDEFIFTMNAKQPEKMDRETANTIRKVITKECPGEKVDVPIRWHLLDHRSRKVSDGLNRKVLSREEYGRIAASLNINEESCEGALNFFNSLNTIFYFPKALPNLVFLDPQILLDKFSELVAKSYRMNLYHKPAQPKTVQAMKPKKYHFQFRDFAQVTEELLNEFSVHYHPHLFTSRELVILFEKLLIFGKLRKGVWFVPSILPPLKEEQVAQYRESKAGALLIYFPDGGPQNGIFCSTVAYLLSPDNTFPCPWEVLMDCDKPVCLTRNVILFTMGDFPGEVTLIEQWTHFEIHVRTDPEREGDVWQLVHSAMFHGLAKAAETHHYSSTDNVPQPAIVCPKHYNLPTTHPATISCKGKWKCTQSSRWFGQVSTENVPWLNLLTPHTQQLEPTSTQLPPLPTATPTSVTLPQLICFKTRCGSINVLEQIGTHYRKLGVLLLEDAAGQVTQAIIEQHHEDATKINNQIFQKWIQGKGKLPVEWSTLIQVLKDVGLVQLANEIEQTLK